MFVWVHVLADYSITYKKAVARALCGWTWAELRMRAIIIPASVNS